MSGEKILNNLDFSNIIGGPLSAAVEAQRDSAAATLAFISQVGFTPSSKNIQESNRLENDAVTKKTAADAAPNDATKRTTAITARKKADDYKLEIENKATGDVRYVSFNYDLAREDAGDNNKGQIRVPILTIVPIPYLSITSMDLDFSTKITESYSNDESRAVQYGGSYRSKSARFRCHYSNKSSSEKNESLEASFDMKVHIHAENIDMPAGLSRILGILEANLISNEVESSTSE